MSPGPIEPQDFLCLNLLKVEERERVFKRSLFLLKRVEQLHSVVKGVLFYFENFISFFPPEQNDPCL